MPNYIIQSINGNNPRPKYVMHFAKIEDAKEHLREHKESLEDPFNVKDLEDNFEDQGGFKSYEVKIDKDGTRLQGKLTLRTGEVLTEDMVIKKVEPIYKVIESNNKEVSND